MGMMADHVALFAALGKRLLLLSVSLLLKLAIRAVVVQFGEPFAHLILVCFKLFQPIYEVLIIEERCHCPLTFLP